MTESTMSDWEPHHTIGSVCLHLCDVVPFQRSIAAIPDATVEKTTFDSQQIPAIKAFKQMSCHILLEHQEIGSHLHHSATDARLCSKRNVALHTI